MVNRLPWPKTIRAQLRLGFGAILLVSCVSSAIGYSSLQRLRTSSQASLDSAARVRELSLELQVNFLQARQAEKDYLREWRMASFRDNAQRYIVTNHAFLTAAQDNLASLETIPGDIAIGDELDLLAALFINYMSAFEATADRIADGGAGYELYQELHRTLRFLAEEVTLVENARIQRLLWELVANGQAFFNTGDLQYINDVKLGLGQLNEALASLETYDDTSPLNDLSQAYLANLNDLLLLNQQIRVNSIISANINQEINQLIESISGTTEAQAAQARQQLAQTARQTSLALLTTSIMALGLTVWASLWLGRRIIGPLTALAATAESIAQGNLDQSLKLTGADEFTTVAMAFNQMMAQLRQNLATLEQQVSDRTRALAAANQTLQGQTEALELALQQLQRSETEYRQLIENLHTGVVVHGADGRIEMGNQRAWDLLQLSPADIAEPSVPVNFVDEMGAPLPAENHPVHQVLSSQVPLQNVVLGIRSPARPDSSWVLVNAFPTFEETAGDRILSQVIVTFIDISDRKLAEEELRYQAMHDALTGLPNRVLFAQHLDHALQRIKRHPDRRFAVLFIDLDRFKVINDSLGHLVGDQLLIQVATILKRHVRTSDMVARLGGDEFVVLLEHMSEPREVIQVVERIQTDTRLPMHLAEHTVFTSASIGIAMGGENYATGEDILRDADNAMYWAKTQGKSRYAVFDPDMHQSAIRLFELETSLRQALEREQFSLYYQPIVCLGTGKLLGFEALVRWQHPEHGLIAPGEFLPIAKETGLMVPLSEWIFQTACRQMACWLRQFPTAKDLSVSVNVAADQLKDADFLEFLDQTLVQAGLKAIALKLEVTENLLLENVDKVLATLLKVQKRGIEISIDDFGTGYSSLSYLKQFPINTLKIDKSFVDDLGHDREDASIVKAIIQIAQSLKMNVVAEGVETEAQRQRLQQLGCDACQGYLVSRPLASEQATDFIQRPFPPSPPR
ncbi:GGDEF domain-containing protein [filamentous cyanobacterium CCP5]|nr:GGDEF domain-containing protein [filamentous cyanobacterium CCP5]